MAWHRPERQAGQYRQAVDLPNPWISDRSPGRPTSCTCFAFKLMQGTLVSGSASPFG